MKCGTCISRQLTMNYVRIAAKSKQLGDERGLSALAAKKVLVVSDVKSQCSRNTIERTDKKGICCDRWHPWFCPCMRLRFPGSNPDWSCWGDGRAQWEYIFVCMNRVLKHTPLFQRFFNWGAALHSLSTKQSSTVHCAAWILAIWVFESALFWRLRWLAYEYDVRQEGLDAEIRLKDCDLHAVIWTKAFVFLAIPNSSWLQSDSQDYRGWLLLVCAFLKLPPCMRSINLGLRLGLCTVSQCPLSSVTFTLSEHQSHPRRACPGHWKDQQDIAQDCFWKAPNNKIPLIKIPLIGVFILPLILKHCFSTKKEELGCTLNPCRQIVAY